MINHIETEDFASDSKSPSASPDHRFEVGILGFGEIQDTEPIDEAITLDSSLLETPFQKLYEDTELIVDNGNCCDEETLNQEFDGVDEVVNDSEDEVGRTTCFQELSLKTADILLESDGSNDHECQQKGNQELKCDTVTCLQDSSRITDNSQGRGLDFLNSQEPGDSTQADAIGFVDNLLMDIDLNLSPVDNPENSWRMRSPPFSGAKGPQSLAKRIKTTSPTKKLSVFDWDSDQCNVSDPQYIREDPGVKKGFMDLCENRKVSTHPMQNSSEKHRKMEQGLSQGIKFTSQMDDAKLQDKSLKEQWEPEEDFIDVGINTQIAAEAMSALLYSPCSKEESDPNPGRISEMRDQVTPNVSQKQRNSKKKRNFSKIERTGTNVSAITCLLNLDELRHPRAKRSRLMQRHHVPARKSWGVSSVKERSETNTLSSGLRVSLNGTRQASSCQSGVNDLDVANHVPPRKIHGRSHESSCNKDELRPSLKKELKRLGEPGKVDYDSRRRRNLTHARVLFSHNLDDETINQQTKIMVRLGISPATSSADSTHFVADRFARTRNMLEAIALGKPVVTPLWLESCREARCLIDEKSYILRDNKKEKEIGFCMLTSLARAKQRPLLKGLKVCITPNIKPSRDMIVDLVKLTHGQVVEIIAAEDRNLPDDLLVLSCEDDRNFCLPFINQGAVIYTSELLLNGIVIQKLEYARHGLSSIADERIQRNTKFTTRSSFLSSY